MMINQQIFWNYDYSRPIGLLKQNSNGELVLDVGSGSFGAEIIHLLFEDCSCFVMIVPTPATPAALDGQIRILKPDDEIKMKTKITASDSEDLDMFRRGSNEEN
jgi:hypothetical protein